jgi:HD-like signal output (HDOD) protein
MEILESAQVESADLGLLAKLPPFAPVAIQLLRILDRPDVEPREVAGQIAADPALRGQLLAIANSPLFGLRVTVQEPLHAIALLGIEQTRSLAVTWTMRALHAGSPKSGVVRLLWRHSLATGIIAEKLADAYLLAPPRANSAGTLHDIGRVALLAAYRDVYGKLLMQTQDSPAQMLDEEKLQIGLNHCEAGGILMKSWGLAPELVHAATGHHQPSNGSGLNSLIHLSCQLATSFGFAAVTQPEYRTPDVIVSETVPAELQTSIRQRLPALIEQIDRSLEKLDF